MSLANKLIKSYRLYFYYFLLSHLTEPVSFHFKNLFFMIIWR